MKKLRKYLNMTVLGLFLDYDRMNESRGGYDRMNQTYYNRIVRS